MQVALPGRVVVSDEADPLVGVRQAPQPQQPCDPPHQPGTTRAMLVWNELIKIIITKISIIDQRPMDSVIR